MRRAVKLLVVAKFAAPLLSVSVRIIMGAVTMKVGIAIIHSGALALYCGSSEGVASISNMR